MACGVVAQDYPQVSPHHFLPRELPPLAVDLETSPLLWGRPYGGEHVSMGVDQPSLFRPEHGWEVVKGKPPHRVMVLGVGRYPLCLGRE